MHYDTATISARDCYQLLVGTVIPRPIAWVSTVSGTGITNLAPFSFFTVASCSPPVLAFTQINTRNGVEKDTLHNLRETRECVVNVVAVDALQSMNASSGEYPPETSEFETLSITTAPSVAVASPGVAAALVRYECTLREVIGVSDLPGGGQLILLDVVHIYVADEVLVDGRPNAERLDALGKLGGDLYATVRDRREAKRPKVS